MLRYSALALVALSLWSCSLDPEYRKQKFLESGIKYYDSARYREASIMFRKSFSLDRKFGPAYYRLGLTEVKQSLLADAVPVFRRAHELLPPGTAEADDADLKLSEILVLSAQSQPNNEAIVAEVQRIVDGLLKRKPNSFPGHKLSGDLAMLSAQKLLRAGAIGDVRKKLDMAISEYRTALGSTPGDPVATVALGRALEVSGGSDEAVALFKGLIARDKTNLNGYLELYRIYAGRKDAQAAEGILRAGISANPNESPLRLALARFYFVANKPTELLALFNDMKGRFKTFPDAYIDAGDFFLRMNSLDEAIKQYEEGIKKDADHKVNYLKHEIEAYIAAGKTSLALAKNDVLLKIDPKDPEARGFRAAYQLDQGDVNGSLGELQALVTAKPSNFVARFNLGRAHAARGEYEQARQEFAAAIQIRPDYLPARLAHIRILLLRNDAEGALREAEQGILIAPNNIEVRVAKATALERLKRTDEARAQLTSIIKAQPKQEDSLLQLAMLDLSEKKAAEARELFHRAWQANPNNLKGLLGESRTWILEHRLDKAVEVVQTEARKNPANPDLQRELGNTQVSVGQYDTGIATFRALIARTTDPRLQGDLWERMGEAYARKPDIPQTIDAMEKAHRLLPDNAAISMNLGMLYERSGDIDMARKYYQTSLTADPNNWRVLNNLAYLTAENNGDLDQALTYATRAKVHSPDQPAIDDTIGWIYLKKKLNDNAIDIYRALLAKTPQSSTFHYHYAIALFNKGDRDQAKRECQTALERNPKKQEETEIRQLLAKTGQPSTVYHPIL